MERRMPITHWPIPPRIQLLFLSIGAAKGYSSDSFKMELTKSYWFLSYFCSGLPGHGSTIGAPIPTWKTFHSRIMVLLSEEASANNLMGSGVLNLLQSQSLLELALRMTAAAADPCHENLTCCVEMSSSLNRLGTLRDLDYGMKNLVTLLKLRTHIQIVVIRLSL
ncbi:hypothetical protein AAC387_Pa05g0682 [Persea americana]